MSGNLGKYRLSPATLISLGYLKATTPLTSEGVNNPNNWTGLNGMFSANDFLQSADTQELAVYEYTQSNYVQLQNLGLITDSTTKDVIAGLLNAAHSTSPQAVADWVKTGVDGKNIAVLYKLGQYSQTQTALLQKSDYSKQFTR